MIEYDHYGFDTKTISMIVTNSPAFAVTPAQPERAAGHRHDQGWRQLSLLVDWAGDGTLLGCVPRADCALTLPGLRTHRVKAVAGDISASFFRGQ
jgi:hypothetical protein